MTKPVSDAAQKAPPPAPEGLSARSADLWAAVVQGRRSAAWLALLEAALRSLDRAEQARRELDATGLMSVTSATGTTHMNPLARIEREHRVIFARLWAQLGLDRDDNLRW